MNPTRSYAGNASVTKPIFAIIVFLLGVGAGIAQTKPDPLKSGFQNPPAGARPRVWWHWMNGNITQEGIKLDLEWMHRVGLAGFQNFDAALSTPKVVENRLAYMTPEWKEAFKYATILADRLGIEEAIAGSPGWSESGGPWVLATQGMKKYVWSETFADGGRPFTGTLAHPPSNTGVFQNLGLEDETSLKFKPPQFYADTAVIAYKVPAGDVPLAELQPKITSSSGSIDAALLGDGDLVKTTALPRAPEGEKAWIQYEFPQPHSIRALTLVLGRTRFRDYVPPSGDTGQALEASDDNQTYHVVAVIPKGGTTEHTISFSPATAKFFRVTFKTIAPPQPSGDDEETNDNRAKIPAEYPIAELVLIPGARVNRFEDKAAFTPVPDLSEATKPATIAGTIPMFPLLIDFTMNTCCNFKRKG